VAEDKKKHKWIKNAINPEHKGEFREKAEHAGKSTAAYAREHEHDSGKTGKQARLAETLMAMHHAHHKNSASNKTIRHSFYGKEKE